MAFPVAPVAVSRFRNQDLLIEREQQAETIQSDVHNRICVENVFPTRRFQPDEAGHHVFRVQGKPLPSPMDTIDTVFRK